MNIASQTLALLPLLLLTSSACSFTEKNEMPSHTIAGSVTGLSDRGTLTLRLGDETQTFSADGDFEFSALSLSGEELELAIVGQPERAACAIEKNVDEAGDTQDTRLVTCLGTDSTLLDLNMTTFEDFDLEFDPNRLDYRVELSTIVQELRLVPVASDADAKIVIESAQVTSTYPSPAMALALGSNVLRVVVTAPDESSTTYFVTAVRGESALLQRAYGKASAGESADTLGASLAISGDTMVVGAPGEDSSARGVNGDESDNTADYSGAAYVFRRVGATWEQEAYLKASSADGEGFGSSVAIHGDTIVVGMPTNASAAKGINGEETSTSAPDSGAVYVFRRDAGQWSQEAFIKASNAESEDNFGVSVAVWGDAIAVGADREASTSTGVGGDQLSNTAANSGAVYIFRRVDAAWMQESYLKASNAEANDGFGYRLTMDQDRVAIAARAEDGRDTGVNGDESSNLAPLSGAVYVFHRLETTWIQEAYIKASNTATYDFFGSSLALSGTTLAIGALGEDSDAVGVNGQESSNASDYSGAAYIFRLGEEGWEQEAYLKASNTAEEAFFGFSIAVVGDLVAVGAIGESSASSGIDGNQDDFGKTMSGAVYLFRRGTQGWSQVNYVKASNADENDWFGVAVGLSGNTLAVSSPEEDGGALGFPSDESDASDDSSMSSGAVYLFR